MSTSRIRSKIRKPKSNSAAHRALNFEYSSRSDISSLAEEFKNRLTFDKKEADVIYQSAQKDTADFRGTLRNYKTLLDIDYIDQLIQKWDPMEKESQFRLLWWDVEQTSNPPPPHPLSEIHQQPLGELLDPSKKRWSEIIVVKRVASVEEIVEEEGKGKEEKANSTQCREAPQLDVSKKSSEPLPPHPTVLKLDHSAEKVVEEEDKVETSTPNRFATMMELVHAQGKIWPINSNTEFKFCAECFVMVKKSCFTTHVNQHHPTFTEQMRAELSHQSDRTSFKKPDALIDLTKYKFKPSSLPTTTSTHHQSSTEPTTTVTENNDMKCDVVADEFKTVPKRVIDRTHLPQDEYTDQLITHFLTELGLKKVEPKKECNKLAPLPYYKQTRSSGHRFLLLLNPKWSGKNLLFYTEINKASIEKAMLSLLDRNVQMSHQHIKWIQSFLRPRTVPQSYKDTVAERVTASSASVQRFPEINVVNNLDTSKAGRLFITLFSAEMIHVIRVFNTYKSCEELKTFMELLLSKYTDTNLGFLLEKLNSSRLGDFKGLRQSQQNALIHLLTSMSGQRCGTIITSLFHEDKCLYRQGILELLKCVQSKTGVELNVWIPPFLRNFTMEAKSQLFDGLISPIDSETKQDASNRIVEESGIFKDKFWRKQKERCEATRRVLKVKNYGKRSLHGNIRDAVTRKPKDLLYKAIKRANNISSYYSRSSLAFGHSRDTQSKFYNNEKVIPEEDQKVSEILQQDFWHFIINRVEVASDFEIDVDAVIMLCEAYHLNELGRRTVKQDQGGTDEDSEDDDEHEECDGSESSDSEDSDGPQSSDYEDSADQPESSEVEHAPQNRHLNYMVHSSLLNSPVKIKKRFSEDTNELVSPLKKRPVLLPHHSENQFQPIVHEQGNYADRRASSSACNLVNHTVNSPRRETRSSLKIGDVELQSLVQDIISHQFEKIRIEPSKIGSGFGCFANRDLKRLEILTIYPGRRITIKEFNAIPEGDLSRNYALQITARDVVILGATVKDEDMNLQGCGMKFNYAPTKTASGHRANCEYIQRMSMFDPKEFEILVIAKHFIKEGTELLGDYRDDTDPQHLHPDDHFI